MESAASLMFRRKFYDPKFHASTLVRPQPQIIHNKPQLNNENLMTLIFTADDLYQRKPRNFASYKISCYMVITVNLEHFIVEIFCSR